mgnify:CR=1 FL=1
MRNEGIVCGDDFSVGGDLWLPVCSDTLIYYKKRGNYNDKSYEYFL